jgi:hypothetical protein
VFSCRMCSMVECVLHETNNVFRWAVKVWSPKTVRCVCVCVCICVCVYIYIHTCSCWRLLRQMGQLTFAILRRVCVCVCVCVFVCVCVCVCVCVIYSCWRQHRQMGQSKYGTPSLALSYAPCLATRTPLWQVNTVP